MKVNTNQEAIARGRMSFAPLISRTLFDILINSSEKKTKMEVNRITAARVNSIYDSSSEFRLCNYITNRVEMSYFGDLF
jgi:hypothetical protein